jgi:hypothetical protein
MNLPINEVGEEDIFYTLEKLVEILNENEPLLEKNDKGESVMPGDLDQIKERVCLATERFGEKNPFFQETGQTAKSFLSSPLMTYTHISGVYGVYTGEANINTNYPHFIVTASIAHESCHAAGIGAENECNFLAAVILMESEDPYLAYCGALFLVDDFVKVCRQTDKKRANEIYGEADSVVRRDFAAYSRFFDPYRSSAAAKVADNTNSTYLKSMGQKEGTVSYSRVIGLTAAFFRQKAS